MAIPIKGEVNFHFLNDIIALVHPLSILSIGKSKVTNVIRLVKAIILSNLEHC